MRVVRILEQTRIESLCVALLFIIQSIDAIVGVIDPAIFGDLSIDLTLQVLKTESFSVERIVARRGLVLKPQVGDVEVLLEHKHLLQCLLLQVDVLLLNVGQSPRVVDLVFVDGPWIPPLHLRVVLFVVLDVLALKSLDHTFQVGGLEALHALSRQALLRDVSIVKVDPHVLVLQVEVPSDSGVSHNLLVLIRLRVVDFVAVEHRDLVDVLQGWLQTSVEHDVLLDQLHLTLVAARNLLLLRNRNRVKCPLTVAYAQVLHVWL